MSLHKANKADLNSDNMHSSHIFTILPPHIQSRVHYQGVNAEGEASTAPSSLHGMCDGSQLNVSRKIRLVFGLEYTQHIERVGRELGYLWGLGNEHQLLSYAALSFCFPRSPSLCILFFQSCI